MGVCRHFYKLSPLDSHPLKPNFGVRGVIQIP